MKVFLMIIIVSVSAIYNIKLKTKNNDLSLIEHEYGNFSKFAEGLFDEKNIEKKYKPDQNDILVMIEKNAKIFDTSKLEKITSLIGENTNHFDE